MNKIIKQLITHLQKKSEAVVIFCIVRIFCVGMDFMCFLFVLKKLTNDSGMNIYFTFNFNLPI